MHRAISRAIRGTCRKWRENDVPSVAGEEVRKNHEKEKFVPPRHTINEAIGWTTGLYLTVEVCRRRHTYVRCEDPKESTSTGTGSCSSVLKKCPFGGLATKAISYCQPSLLSTASYINPVKSRQVQSKPVSKQTSIDTTPFLTESLLFSASEESGISDDDDISFLESFTSQSTVKPSNVNDKPEKPADLGIAAFSEKFAGDALSALGAFQYLLGNSKPRLGADPGIDAIELLQKGATLGSSRALYNLGVVYERQNDSKIAFDYYERAANLGHPLASYNLGVYKMRNGSYSEALRLMDYAKECGVPEASKAITKIRVSQSIAIESEKN